MALSKHNTIVHGATGKFGDMIVIRQRAGKTFLVNAPKKRTSPPTEGEQKMRNTFAKAIHYGKKAIADPETKAIYHAGATNGQTAFNVAVSDFYRPPQINEIDASDYNTEIGSTIIIDATDNFKVKSVSIRIEHPGGSMIEEGDAIQSRKSNKWIFTARVTNPNIAGSKIIVTAKDMAGNVTKQEIVL